MSNFSKNLSRLRSALHGEGTYTESLTCGGELKVRKNDWWVYFYFAGPDLRYNGTSLTIGGDEMENYIHSLLDNWADLQQLIQSVPEGSKYEKLGKAGMTIEVGGWQSRFQNGRGSVCLKDYYKPISLEADLHKTVDSFKYAQRRARQIMQILLDLEPVSVKGGYS